MSRLASRLQARLPAVFRYQTSQLHSSVSRAQRRPAHAGFRTASVALAATGLGISVSHEGSEGKGEGKLISVPLLPVILPVGTWERAPGQPEKGR
jgi:hypothetical protein